MLLNEFNKVMPLLKYGFFVKWLNKDEPNGWYSYQTFANEYDFTKNFELTLKKTQLKVTFDRRIPDVY